MPPADVTAETFSSRKVCLARAREHLGNRAYVAARQTLSRGVRQWPQLEFSHDYRTLLGHAAWRQGCLREARRLLTLATWDSDCHIEARFLLGRVLLDAGQVERAIQHLSGILNDSDALVPYRVHAGGALSVAYSALGLNKSSQDALEEAAGFGLISAQLLADEGFRLLRIGAYPEAEVQLAKGLQVDSTCEDAFYRLGNALFIQGKTEPALEVLAYGVEQSPEYPPFYRLMSEVYASRGQQKESAAFLKRALEISPNLDEADAIQFMLAAAMQRAGRIESAIACLRELMQQHPRSRYRYGAALRLKALESNSSGSSARLHGFPRKLQKRAYCAPNTLANVLTFSGVKATQDDVAAKVMRGMGSHWPDVLDYLKQVEGITSRVYLGDLELLRKCIDGKLPVVANEYHGTSGHALAVIGYDNRTELLIAQDPRFFEPVEIPYQEFERAWQHDDGLCVAVAPKTARATLPAQSAAQAEEAAAFVELLRLRAADDDDVALEVATRLAEAYPQRQMPVRIRTEIALGRRDAETMQQLCRQALERWPGCFWARRHLGDALWMAGNQQAAMAEYRAARRLDRRDPALAYALGELLLAMGETRRGRVYLLRALREDPFFHRARLRLAQNLADDNRKDEALFHARLLVEYQPEHAEGRRVLAVLAGDQEVRTLTEGARAAAEDVERRQAASEVARQAAQAAEDEELELDLDDL